MDMKILWIEGRRNVAPQLVPGLRKRGYEVETVPTGREALAYIPTWHPDLAVVNAASLRTSGWRICGDLRDNLNTHPIILITDQAPQSKEPTDVNQVLVLPFTIRKLLNRIKILGTTQGEKAMKAGNLTLYPDLQMVRIGGSRPQPLTPNLTMLLKVLMQHPGQVLARETLFRRVWQTDYVKDTRTLDVHICWLRQKIEANPQKPQLLKTIRGVGFRLDT